MLFYLTKISTSAFPFPHSWLCVQQSGKSANLLPRSQACISRIHIPSTAESLSSDSLNLTSEHMTFKSNFSFLLYANFL